MIAANQINGGPARVFKVVPGRRLWMVRLWVKNEDQKIVTTVKNKMPATAEEMVDSALKEMTELIEEMSEGTGYGWELILLR